MNFMNAGLYIHIPFCYSKCPYCDFFSIVSDNKLIKKNYLNALKKEIEIYSKKFPKIRIQSIYLGGGTPTVLSGQQITEIIALCFSHFKINRDIEITIESNPATLDSKKAVSLLRAGINRLSLGAQSFNNRLLKRIGRIHSKQGILHSYKIARAMGFKNMNIDLMFGLPGQTLKQFKKSLKEVVQLCPEHVSLYALFIEPGTTFDNLLKGGALKIPSDDIVYDMYQKAIDFLGEHGYDHYEISNFALPGKRCLHNLIYWKNQSYLGLGTSSTSYINNKRFKNYSDLSQYIYLLEHHILPIESKEVLPLKEEMAETVILHLRMMDGLSKHDFMSRFNKPVEAVFSEQLKQLKKQGLLDASESNYFLTKKGIPLSNIAFREFLD